MSESKLTTTIIPAAPGWYIAMLIIGCHSGTKEEQWDDYLGLHPIVAWEIERYQQPEHLRWKRRVSHDVTPLTAMGNMNGHTNPWAIKSPDGKFDVNGSMFDNEADVIQELKEQYEETSRGNVERMQGKGTA